MIPLLILGLLKQNPGSHGYELLALMEERHYKYVVNFTKGSFYYNLQQLEEKLYIKRVSLSEKLDNSRETHNYVITETGDVAFEKLMQKYGSKTEYVNLSFYAALLFSEDYSVDEMKKLIKMQIEQSMQKVELLEQSIKDDREISEYFRKMLENSRSHHLVNINWFETLLAELS